MGRKSKCEYAGIEAGLRKANTEIIKWDRHEVYKTRRLIEKIVRKIVNDMKAKSPKVFGKLYHKIFGGGSSYEGLKVGKPDEFDIDILLKFPEVVNVNLITSGDGYVQLHLENLNALQKRHLDIYNVFQHLVDERNYLSTNNFKSAFMESIFDHAVDPLQGQINIGNKTYRVQKSKPAFTLTIDGEEFTIKIDLVPCFFFSGRKWPKDFKQNPFGKPKDFFVVPKGPNHSDSGYFRLSFQMQERLIMLDRFWMKPTIRIIKRIKEKFQHKVPSYAIKSLFMLEMEKENPNFTKQTPELWKGSFSFCLVYMLEKYLKCLREKHISYFWNEERNLLANLTEEHIVQCENVIERIVQNIKNNPVPETVLRYLEDEDK